MVSSFQKWLMTKNHKRTSEEPQRKQLENIELSNGRWWKGTLKKPYGLQQKSLSLHQHLDLKCFLPSFHLFPSHSLHLNDNCHDAIVHLDSVAMGFFFFFFFHFTTLLFSCSLELRRCWLEWKIRAREENEFVALIIRISWRSRCNDFILNTEKKLGMLCLK